MPESIVPVFRALGPLERYLAELYNHNFGTIGCAIWVDTDVSYLSLLAAISRSGQVNNYHPFHGITVVLGSRILD